MAIPKSILTTDNTKTKHGEGQNIFTGIVYMAPNTIAGRGNVCADATEACILGCLYSAGRGKFSPVQQARINRTEYFFDNNKAYMEQLIKEIESHIRKANKKNMVPAIRLNGTSDIPYERVKYDGKTLMEIFQGSAVLYDYTKSKARALKQPYNLTFSRSGENDKDCLELLNNGVNVAVVFDRYMGESLPKTWGGYEVIDGDISDTRFLDKRGVVVGLHLKKTTRDVESLYPFVVKTKIVDGIVKVDDES